MRIAFSGGRAVVHGGRDETGQETAAGSFALLAGVAPGREYETVLEAELKGGWIAPERLSLPTADIPAVIKVLGQLYQQYQAAANVPATIGLTGKEREIKRLKELLGGLNAGSNGKQLRYLSWERPAGPAQRVFGVQVVTRARRKVLQVKLTAPPEHPDPTIWQDVVPADRLYFH